MLDNDGLTALTTATGEPRWTTAATLPVRTAVTTDGIRLVWSDRDRGIIAADLTDGTTAWTIARSELPTSRAEFFRNSPPISGVYAVGDMLVAVTEGGLVGYSPTGGPADPPSPP